MKETRKQPAEANIKNLFYRYQNYDSDGTKYAFDIRYTTLHTAGESFKAKKQTGADTFMRHIKELTENYQDVSSIIVSDYGGANAKAVMLNPPVTIELLDFQIPQILPKEHEEKHTKPNGMDVLQGLSGLFAGTEFEGLGSLAPLAKFMDDKHTIDRLREKHNEQTRQIAELERRNAELSDKYESLNGDHEQLQDDAADMETELEYYRTQESKNGKWADMLGLAGASIAKNFLKQNPKILSGFIPPEQLAGIFSDDEPQTETQMSGLSETEQARLDEATAVFEWLQGLDDTTFSQVVSIINAMRQNSGYIPHIIQFLNGNQ